MSLHRSHMRSLQRLNVLFLSDINDWEWGDNERDVCTFVVLILFPVAQLQPLRSGRTLHSSPSRHGSIWHHHFCWTIEAEHTRAVFTQHNTTQHRYEVMMCVSSCSPKCLKALQSICLNITFIQYEKLIFKNTFILLYIYWLHLIF